jgi:CRP/FNR family transcriptional regulator
MEKIVLGLEEKKNTLKSCEYFSTLNDDGIEELIQETDLYRFERGEIICWRGEPCKGLYMIQNGNVKLYRLSPNGRELIINVLENSATFNEVPVFDQGTNPVNVSALVESDIWIVDAEAIHRIMQFHPEMAQAVIDKLCKNLRMVVGIVEELSFCQVTNRLARLITQLSPGQLDGSNQQRITQDQLAARLGTVREVVARSLRKLEHSGAIRVQRGQIQVVDQERLHEWAQEQLHQDFDNFES